jgi:hypothetical protein
VCGTSDEKKKQTIPADTERPDSRYRDRFSRPWSLGVVVVVVVVVVVAEPSWWSSLVPFPLGLTSPRKVPLIRPSFFSFLLPSATLALAAIVEPPATPTLWWSSAVPLLRMS